MPLIIRADGQIDPPAQPGGPLVGVWSDANFRERAYRLHPGDMVVAYTDGLLEAHAPKRILAPEDLVGLVGDCHQQPLGVCIRGLEGAALGSSIEPVRDDIAILALQVKSGVADHEAATIGNKPAEAYNIDFRLSELLVGSPGRLLDHRESDPDMAEGRDLALNLGTVGVSSCEVSGRKRRRHLARR